MKILVTGGLGFIGSNFIRYILTQKTCSVINLDIETYSGNPANLDEFKSDERYLWIKGDITDPSVVEEIVPTVDIIVHFAAESHVDRSIQNSSIFVKTNVLGTTVLLDVARRNKTKLFIYVSTDEVYGSIATGTSCESDGLFPNNPYSASKASADLIARSYFVTHKTPIITTRAANNFGPYQYPEKALPLLITNALENKSFPLYGDGLNVRDWIYVLDHVKAIALLIERGVPGEIYNIGGTCSFSNLDLVNKVLELMDKPKSLIQFVSDRPGHDRRYALNSEKLYKTLDWKPEHSFEDALKQTIDWYSRHYKWWEPLKQGNKYVSYYKQQYA